MLADVSVRVATPADANDIAAMSRDLIEHGLPWRWRPARVTNAINDVDTNVAVVGPPGALQAFGIMYHAKDDAHLLLFAVRAGRQRRGIGSALLIWLEAATRASGASRIRVEARLDNEAARIFYNEHGYHERTIDKAMYSGVLDGVHMEKWLRAEG
jgi:ribosomal-protein-alanine N-acetyltransferase